MQNKTQHEAPRGQRIALENLLNTRDLGGIRNQRGARIRQKALIRSGTLGQATDRDIETLSNDYRVSSIIDLRSDEEREHHPDPIEKFKSVRYRSIPLLNGQVIGVTRGSREQYLEEIEMISRDPIGTMIEIYPKIVLEEASEQGFKEFFNELLEHTDGAVLWHCSMGKDRVGLSTALLLKALDVPHETIVTDYLATNTYLEEYTQMVLKRPESTTLPDNLKETIRIFNSVDVRFLESALQAIDLKYGSLTSYMVEVLDVTPDKVKELQGKYLE